MRTAHPDADHHDADTASASDTGESRHSRIQRGKSCARNPDHGDRAESTATWPAATWYPIATWPAATWCAAARRATAFAVALSAAHRDRAASSAA